MKSFDQEHNIEIQPKDTLVLRNLSLLYIFAITYYHNTAVIYFPYILI